MKKLQAFVVGLLVALAVNAYATVVPFPKNARVVLLGDSITEGNSTAGGAVPYHGPLAAMINARYMALGNGTDTGSPIYYPSGTNGDAIATMTAAVATRVCQYRANVVIIEAGTNDATNARTGAQVLADASALIVAVKACSPAPTAIYWVGPNIVGDRWPSGANAAFDASLDTVVTNIKTACANDGTVQYFDIRAAYFAVAPTLNAGNTSGASGICVDVAADGSIKHPTPLGATFWSKTIFNQMTFAP